MFATSLAPDTWKGKDATSRIHYNRLLLNWITYKKVCVVVAKAGVTEELNFMDW